VLVVGAGNSGAEIALDLAPRYPTWLAGRDTGNIPGSFGGFGFRIGGIVFLTVSRLLTVDTFPGRRLVQRARAFSGGHPLVRIKPTDLLEAGVRRVPRVSGANRGKPVLEDGRTIDATTVVWATGFVRDYRWIHLPAFDAKGDPIHHRGVAEAMPGLYFTGLPFQSSLLSGHVAEAGPDAKYIANRITSRARGISFSRGGRIGNLNRQDSSIR
jgi:putative flavoprotein involved in K+ transport